MNDMSELPERKHWKLNIIFQTGSPTMFFANWKSNTVFSKLEAQRCFRSLLNPIFPTWMPNTLLSFSTCITKKVSCKRIYSVSYFYYLKHANILIRPSLAIDLFIVTVIFFSSVFFHQFRSNWLTVPTDFIAYFNG